jgi:chemotaxis protein methyltransferase CheR
MVEPLEVEHAASAALSLRREDLADIELQLLLDALLRYGGCDFRHLNQSVLRRRVADTMRAHGLETISGLQDLLLHDERAFASFVVSIRGGSTHLFAEPQLLRAFVVNVVPLLRTYPFVRVWVPGSGLGADAYALAALFADAGILSKALIYATCINEASVAIAKSGYCEHDGAAELGVRAHQAGLEAPVSSYFDVTEHAAVPNESLRASVMFARHHPASDASINEFVAIVARGFLPLFNGAVQYRLHRLFFESLGHLGFLVLGADEGLTGTVHERAFRRVVRDAPIFRRMR